MGIRKFQADNLFTGKELLNSDQVLITDEQGRVIEISTVAEAGDGIERFEGTISPGFINSHCHLELSHMKGKIPPGSGLINFLVRVIKERNSLPEEILHAMRLAENEMYEAGIVAVGDICNTTDSIPVKENSKLHWFNFIETTGLIEAAAASKMDLAAIALQRFNALELHEPVLSNTSVSPHAPYSVSEKLFRLINESYGGRIISIHNQETEAENELFQNGTGEFFNLYSSLGIDAGSFKSSSKRSLQTYLPWLNNSAANILVHNTCTNKDDLLFINEHNLSGNIFFCICINANRYIQSVNPPIQLLRDHHCTITIGTDSYAGNTQLDILEEIKTIHRHFPDIPLAETLQWATLNGAKALGMDSRLGSFTPGKQPGLVLISNIKHQHVSPLSGSRRLV